jgi:hypothetical protein
VLRFGGNLTWHEVPPVPKSLKSIDWPASVPSEPYAVTPMIVFALGGAERTNWGRGALGCRYSCPSDAKPGLASEVLISRYQSFGNLPTSWSTTTGWNVLLCVTIEGRIVIT